MIDSFNPSGNSSLFQMELISLRMPKRIVLSPALINSFFLFLTCLLASRLTLFRLSTLICSGSCHHCILARFIRSKNRKHSSSNNGWNCFNSCRPKLSLVGVLIFTVMFSQILFMSSLSLKFSEAANLFEILICYCFLTSSSFSLVRLNLSPSNSVLLVYLLPIFP